MKYRCALCKGIMKQVFVACGGGVWLSESSDRVSRVIQRYKIHADMSPKPAAENEPPLYCVIGSSGSRNVSSPFHGLYCPACGAVLIESLREGPSTS
jgi:hypothetical protein